MRYSSLLSSELAGGRPVNVGIAQASGDADVAWLGELSDTLLVRGARIADAYNLHALTSIDVYALNRLSRSRCEAVMDEIEFVSAITSDLLLVEALRVVYDGAVACIRSPSSDAVLVIAGS